MADQRVGAREREAVFTRAGDRCEYCLSPRWISPAPFCIEHVVPVAEGGDDSLDNLALACQGCNGHKYTKTEGLDPDTDQPAPLFHPRHDRWADHFAWSTDHTLIIGRTPTGRATVRALRLNRENLVTLRAVLASAGEHPASGRV